MCFAFRYVPPHTVTWARLSQLALENQASVRSTVQGKCPECHPLRPSLSAETALGNRPEFGNHERPGNSPAARSRRTFPRGKIAVPDQPKAKSRFRENPPEYLVVFLCARGAFAADTPPLETGFVSLFDGKTLDGWKIGQNAEIFQVRDGMIVMECPATKHEPAHLFYDGEVGHHEFKNFHLKVDVMTFPGANSGIYFHTKYRRSGCPSSALSARLTTATVIGGGPAAYNVKNITWGPEAPSENEKANVTMFQSPR